MEIKRKIEGDKNAICIQIKNLSKHSTQKSKSFTIYDKELSVEHVYDRVVFLFEALSKGEEANIRVLK